MLRELFGSSGNLDAATGSTVVVKNTNGMQTISFYVDPPSGGTVVFESTADGENWIGITMRSQDADQLSQSASSADTYIGSISGAMSVRFRTSVAGTASGTVKGAMYEYPSVIEHVEFGAPPHKIGYPLAHHSISATGTASAATVWDPVEGKRFILTDFFIFAKGTSDTVLTIYDETNENGNVLFNARVELANNRQFKFSHSFSSVPFVSDAIDNILKYDLSVACDLDIIVHGYEV